MLDQVFMVFLSDHWNLLDWEFFTGSNSKILRKSSVAINLKH